MSNFTTAVELVSRLPVTALAGVSTCVCGAPCDALGGHLFGCVHLDHLRTGVHDGVQRAAAFMCKCAGFDVVVDSSRQRAASRYFSPNAWPDFSLRGAVYGGAHLVSDVRISACVCPGVAPGGARFAGAVASVGEAQKHAKYGKLPGGHQFLPFVIETGGAWGLDACNLFHQCKSRLADSSGGARGVGEYSGDGFPVGLATWSANGFSAFHRQCVSVSLQRGLGDFVRAPAGVCRGEVNSGVAFRVGG